MLMFIILFSSDNKIVYIQRFNWNLKILTVLLPMPKQAVEWIDLNKSLKILSISGASHAKW